MRSLLNAVLIVGSAFGQYMIVAVVSAIPAIVLSLVTEANPSYTPAIGTLSWLMFASIVWRMTGNWGVGTGARVAWTALALLPFLGFITFVRDSARSPRPRQPERAATRPAVDRPRSVAGLCTHCGAALGAGHRFCGRCGRPVAPADADTGRVQGVDPGGALRRSPPLQPAGGIDAETDSPSYDGNLLESYRKLLSALLGNASDAGVRQLEWPDRLLPAPRDELAAALDRARVVEGDPVARDRLEAMASLLERFSDDPNAVSDFATKVWAQPAALSIAYAVWLGSRGEGWWWLLAAAGLAVGGLWGMFLRFRLAEGRDSAPVRFVSYSLLYLLKLVVLVGSASLWFRLVLGGALYGLYHGIFVEFSLWAIALAVVALVVGYYYSKALNTLFHFLWQTPIAGPWRGT